MSTLKNMILFVMTVSVSACGGKLVESPRDAGSDGLTNAVAETGQDRASDRQFGGSNPDASNDVPRDTSGEASSNAGLDGTTDRAADRVNDANTDRALDAAIDVGQAEVGAVVLDTSGEMGVELAIDSISEAGTGPCSQAPVVLASAANFVVLAGSTVTNTGPTSITGDLGVSPGSAVTGLPPGAVIGTQHSSDPTSAQGIADLTTAYNDAAGRTLCPISVAGNLGGQTLTPGLYKSTSSLSVSGGDLTLDAQGNSTAVFLFQIASTLTTTAGRQVILSNGAKSANVYWQVGTSATLGTTSSFQGTIMADQAVTLETGATLNGRALARIAAVTLDSNTIVNPTP